MEGVGGAFPVKQADLFLGNAGTAFRPLDRCPGAVAGRHTSFSGVARMHERPIGDLVDALRQLGADIAYLGNEGFPPLAIKPATIHAAGRVKVRGNVSSQFLTALLMAAPLAGQDVNIEVVGELISKPYIEITLNLMRRFGVEVERQGWQVFTIRAGQKYRSPGEIHVEGDASSASYFLAAGRHRQGPGARRRRGQVQHSGRRALCRSAGADGRATSTMGDNWIESSGNGKTQGHRPRLQPHPGRRHDPGRRRPVRRRHHHPAQHRQLARQGNRPHRRHGDRTAQSRRDRGGRPGLHPRHSASRLTPDSHAAIDTYDDHRMAMCFSLVALGGVPVRINDPKCVAKTFPDYFERLQLDCANLPRMNAYHP